jgi:hypothetical protein
MLGTGLCDSAIVLEEVVECDRLLEPEVVVEPDGDIFEDTEGCRLIDWIDVDDTEVVELMLGTGLGDGTDELECDVDVEPVGDIIEETESCIVCVLNDVDDNEDVKLILGDELIDSWGELDAVVDVDGEAECIGVDVLDNTALGVPDIEWLCEEMEVSETDSVYETEPQDEDDAV